MTAEKACVVALKTEIALFRDTETYAEPPAKTTSWGSSPTLMVSVTTPSETDTTLTLPETSFTTQASLLVRGFTETGSTPTGISAINAGVAGCVTLKTDNVPFGVLTAKRRVPSADRRIGFV